MPNDNWKSVEAHFFRIRELPAEEQASALEALAAEEPEACRELQELLGEEQTLHPVLKTRPLGPRLLAEAQQLEGRQIGAFRLGRLLGKGGMGAVYLAHRTDGEFDQQVALKLIPPERLSETALGRFRKERQILAGLQHPNIARLYDGGKTDDGQVYFTMEYIDGQPLLQFCEERQCSLRQRISMLLDICSAIAYAHSRMVLHLDIKPGNILAGPDGIPKVLDFGISEESVSHQGNSPAARAYTPAYAAPEQLRGEGPAATHDVYALGVLLYQLLTGQLPYSREQYATARAQEEAVKEPPPPPSARLSGPAASAVRGDLDAIGLKALAADPASRYQSVNQMMEDLRAWLDQRPISLKSGSLYRSRKFIRRNYRLLATIAIALMLILALAIHYAFRLQAERNQALAEAAKARQLMSLLTDAFRAADPFVTQGDTVTAATILGRASGRMEAQLAGQPELLAEMSLALAGVYCSLSNHIMGDSLARRAVALYEGQLPAEKGALAEACFQLGEARYGLGEYMAARESIEKALFIYQALGGRQEQIAECYFTLGDIAIDQLSYHRADSLHRKARDLYLQLYQPPHEKLAASLHALADIQRKLGNFREAEQHYQASLAMKQLLFKEPHTEIAYTLNHLASLYYNMEQPEKALPYAQASFEQRLAVLGPLHEEAMASQSNLTRIYTQMGDYKKALAIRLELLEKARQVYAGRPHPYILFHLHSIGSLHLKLGQNQEAEAALRQATGMAASLNYAETSPERTARFHQQLGEAVFLQERYSEAASILQGALEFLPQGAAEAGPIRYHLSRCYLALGQQQKARAELEAARAIMERSPGENRELLEKAAALLQ